MVLSTDGRVEWVFRSDAFTLPLTERGQKLHPDTLAAAAFREHSGNDKPREVGRGAWLDEPVHVRGTMLESTHFIPSLNQTVSLLWLVGDAGERD
jgi:hypothetical protein